MSDALTSKADVLEGAIGYYACPWCGAPKDTRVLMTKIGLLVGDGLLMGREAWEREWIDTRTDIRLIRVVGRDPCHGKPELGDHLYYEWDVPAPPVEVSHIEEGDDKGGE